MYYSVSGDLLRQKSVGWTAAAHHLQHRIITKAGVSPWAGSAAVCTQLLVQRSPRYSAWTCLQRGADSAVIDAIIRLASAEGSLTNAEQSDSETKRDGSTAETAPAVAGRT